MSLGIQRLAGVALTARDPEAAARFATETLGFNRAAVGPPGGHALVGHGGVDAISLIYVPGDAPGMHHATYIVDEAAGFDALAASVGDAAVEHEADRLAVLTPAGHRLHFRLGAATAVPVGHMAPLPATIPAPLCSDHVALGAPDLEAEVAFATGKLGMLESYRVLAADGAPATVALRFPQRKLSHQLVLTRAQAPTVEHVQFTMKNLDQFYAARDAFEAAGAEIRRGPLRHGPGHMVAVYVTDPEGYELMFSVEEEIILDDEHFVPRTWSAEDARVADEWATA
jgi:catechol 2,3-dioxygenase-like lactoylglutathione lyase family enzyme